MHTNSVSGFGRMKSDVLDVRRTRRRAEVPFVSVGHVVERRQLLPAFAEIGAAIERRRQHAGVQHRSVIAVVERHGKHVLVAEPGGAELPRGAAVGTRIQPTTGGAGEYQTRLRGL